MPSKRDFYDDVSHELRTPLTVLRGHLEVMDTDDPADVARARALAVSEVERMTRLVDDLVTLASAEKPDFVRLRSIDAATLTDEIFRKAQALGDRRWVLGDVADARIPLDAQRIAQAVLELARNAVKFSRPGTTIGIGSATDGEIVRFWVRDEGRGIPADQLDAVVERFGRADARGVEGSGLGLAIVSSIVDAHGGRLVIASTPGVGSTVTIELPCRSAADELPDGSESPSREDAPWVTS